MMEFNKKQYDSWSKVRVQGKLTYAIKWIGILLVYILVLQGVLIMLGRKAMEDISLPPILFASIVLGTIYSMTRWFSHEKRWMATEQKLKQE